MNGAAEHAKQQPSRSKRWTFRVLAVLLGLSPFLVLEAILRVTHWRPPVPVSDPFVGFQSVRPLFVADQDKRRMTTAQNRLEYFQPDSFELDKPENEYRIFCVGGSTVQGRPYAIETSFTTWLELALQAADSSRRWEAINCGGVSYASYRLVPIVQEILRYEPDLIILYTGHNEFLEDRGYQLAREMPEFVADSYGELSRLKTLQYLHWQLAGDTDESDTDTRKESLTTEVQALLDYQGGLEIYHRDPQWQSGIAEHFKFNLRRMIDLSNQAGVPIMVVDPPVNLIHCPPFKSEHSTSLSVDSISRVEQLIQQATDASQTDIDLAIDLLEQADEIDPGHAGIHFQLGSYYADSGRYREANRQFQIACNEDICPLRITEPLAEVLRTVTTVSGTQRIEVRRKFEEQSEGGIPGNNLFFDHVHPSFRGHQLIAVEIVRTLEALKIVKPRESWEAERERLFSQHWDSLDPVYFAAR